MSPNHLSRRSFVGGVGAAISGALIGSHANSDVDPCRFRIGGCSTWIRQNVASLSESQRASFIHGVEVMKSRPASDPTSWRFQANIHGTNDPPHPLFNQCEHFTIQFLTWHRAYLYFFERILRAASGNPFLALPYWDWNASPSLPLPFREPAMAANPLFDGTRNINDGSAIPSQFVVDDLNTALGYVDFDGFNGFSPSFEGSPHGQVHVIVGGNMSGFNNAAKDPIFWLHHCNIDRVWDQWLNLQGGRLNPSGSAFLDQEYSFVDEHGATVTVRVRDILWSYCLQYRYDDAPNPQRSATTVVSQAVQEGPEDSAPKVFGSSLEKIFQLQAPDDAEPVPIGFEPHAATLYFADDADEALQLLPDPPTNVRSQNSVILEIQDIRFSEVPSFSYGVYLNLPDEELNAEEKRRHYAGSINFFGHEHKHRAADGTVHTMEGPVTFTQKINATKAVMRLRAASLWSEDLTATLEPLTPVGGETEAHVARAKASAERAKLSYKRIVIYVARPSTGLQ